MSKTYKVGQGVTWQWGAGVAEGTVEAVEYETLQITTRGKTITRHGSEENPAIIIKQDSGTKVLKLASELN